MRRPPDRHHLNRLCVCFIPRKTSRAHRSHTKRVGLVQLGAMASRCRPRPVHHSWLPTPPACAFTSLPPNLPTPRRYRPEERVLAQEHYPVLKTSTGLTLQRSRSPGGPRAPPRTAPRRAVDVRFFRPMGSSREPTTAASDAEGALPLHPGSSRGGVKVSECGGDDIPVRGAPQPGLEDLPWSHVGAVGGPGPGGTSAPSRRWCTPSRLWAPRPHAAKALDPSVGSKPQTWCAVMEPGQAWVPWR